MSVESHFEVTIIRCQVSCLELKLDFKDMKSGDSHLIRNLCCDLWLHSKHTMQHCWEINTLITYLLTSHFKFNLKISFSSLHHIRLYYWTKHFNNLWMQIASWANEGLPSDRMSIENATILTNCERWPLMIDPQLQGYKWIRMRYGSGLKVELFFFKTDSVIV